MHDVGPHRGYECVIVGTIEELHPNLVVSVQNLGAQPMHSIDHTHRVAMHKNRGQYRICFGESASVLRIFSCEAR